MKIQVSLLFSVLLCSVTAAAAANGVRQMSTERKHHEHQAIESRIIGGNPADEGEYLYFTSWNGCAASLIAPNIILSAAHCNSGISNDNVIVGAYQKWWGQTSGDAESRTIVERREHPSYDPSTFANDFLVMKLDEPITTFPPVKLNLDPSRPINGEALTVIGFGAVFQGGWGSRLLQEVEVNYVAHDICNQNYEGDIVESVMLCAGVPGGGKDSCQGDSGGPIVVKTNEGHFQVGVVSWGFGCGQAEFPGVYSRISGASEWIDEMICELSPEYCDNTGRQPTDPPVVLPSPTNPPVIANDEICTDSSTGTCFIDMVQGARGCDWLSDNMDEYGYLCKFVDCAFTCKSLCNAESNICNLIDQALM